MLEAFKSRLAKECPKRVESVGDYYRAPELKLKGIPWITSNVEVSTATKLFLCQFINIYQSLGYKLYASVGMSSKQIAPIPFMPYFGGAGRDMECWVFRKVTDLWGK